MAELPLLLGVIEVLPQREALVAIEAERPQARETLFRLHAES